MGRGAELVEAERGDNQYKTIHKSGNSSPLSVALAGASSPRGEPLFAYTASGNQAFNHEENRQIGKNPRSCYKTASGNQAFNVMHRIEQDNPGAKRYKTASGNQAFNCLETGNSVIFRGMVTKPQAVIRPLTPSIHLPWRHLPL